VPPVHLEGDHLPGGMNPAVGAPRAGHTCLLPGHGGQRPLDRALDGRFVPLALKALVSRAVVGQRGAVAQSAYSSRSTSSSSTISAASPWRCPSFRIRV
jgi:hypothetical protein